MLPASLQAIKNQARIVQEDAASIDSAQQAAWREQLIDAAHENLGDLWQYTSGQPSHYKPADATFEILIPDHRPIYARFGVLNSGHAFWARDPWHSGTARDVDGREHTWWMVARDQSRDLPTYYHTLGAALLAAEE